MAYPPVAPWCFQCRKKRAREIEGSLNFCSMKCAVRCANDRLHSGGHYWCAVHDIWYEDRCTHCAATACENR